MLAPKRTVHSASGALKRGRGSSQQRELLTAHEFRRMLNLEQRRSERSHRRFVLMLLDWTHLLNGGTTADLRHKVLHALACAIRDTDITGWYEEETISGVIFTEIGDAESRTVARALLTRVMQTLTGFLGIEQIHKIVLSFHVFPDETASASNDESSDGGLFVEKSPSGVSGAIKRVMDIGGSLSLIVLGSPLLLTIAAAVKLTSSGPVLFRQTRIGRNGRPFTFMKFRSMYHGNDPHIHEEYVARLIKGELEPGTTQFKITADPRVTRFGKFLRRTSLDELPQFFNVVMGDMSLVGPRPPLPYELDRYEWWHRRRLSEAKPGITGLWQVTGRSRVGFDDMVRLDLRYARSWSLWLDVKILLQTPRAVVSGNGAH